MAHILIGVAWPYASGPRHLGHAVSTFIPADIFARYHRMKGDEVLMVGGSDMHGTPAAVRADEEGVTAEVVAQRYHALHRQNIEALGVRYDLYWNTAAPGHKARVQEIFATLLRKGYLVEQTMVSPYCPKDRRFNPDRYVEGECPLCHFKTARGDQCENCGNLMDPFELINPKCRTCGTPPEARETKHFFFRLSAFQERLQTWMAEGKSHWRAPVLSETLGWLRTGLKDRPVTRDLDWGIELPVAGFEGKRIYVWFEAVMGYLTASMQWAQEAGRPEAWKAWWHGKDTRSYYFIGKDNIVFHCLFWPAILMGYDEALNLPHDVTATQFLNTAGGEKMSAGRGIGVTLPDLLARFDPDQIRYYATAVMPELRDADFSWDEFVAKNNSELLAVYGNFAHRVLTFTQRNYGEIPAAAVLDGVDQRMIRSAQDQQAKVAANLEHLHFKDALREAIQIARLGNQYFDAKAPWDLVKKDREACGTVLHVCLRVCRGLAVTLAPFLPFSSERLWTMLGESGSVHASRWDAGFAELPPGRPLAEPKPLFAKVELPAETGAEEDRLDVRAATVLAVNPHPNADKLYVVEIDLGTERRTLVAGLKEHYRPEELLGKTLAVLCNLEPAKLRGVQSNGMLLAAEDANTVAVLEATGHPPGTQLLGTRGAPRMPFSEFQRFTIDVDSEGAAHFRGVDAKADIVVGSPPVRSGRPVAAGSRVR